ncbi:hypothetical protein ACFRIC_08680 [Streptomyces sp. NPDC056738]|uniref:hypothetical protein n=1 Tax=Streptomyces sp. NPDC056738 TaxID=3345933 RepID=UPI0036BB4B28
MEATPSTIIEVNGLPDVHMTLEILGMTDEDVAEARRQAAVCNVEHPLVMRMFSAFTEGFGLEPDGPEWSVGEVATLLQALRLLPSWAAPDDIELAHLLMSAPESQGGGGRVG